MPLARGNLWLRPRTFTGLRRITGQAARRSHVGRDASEVTASRQDTPQHFRWLSSNTATNPSLSDSLDKCKHCDMVWGMAVNSAQTELPKCPVFFPDDGESRDFDWSYKRDPRHGFEHLLIPTPEIAGPETVRYGRTPAAGKADRWWRAHFPSKIVAGPKARSRKQLRPEPSR